MYQLFYEQVKRWTARDFWTPGFKAEVVLDTLLSPFVADIAGQRVGRELVLLAKEFPIRPVKNLKRREENRRCYQLDLGGGLMGRRPARVDYLLAAPATGTLYLAELKTERRSFKEMNQPLAMVWSSLPEADLFGFYRSVREEKTQARKKAWYAAALLRAAREAGIRLPPDAEQPPEIELLYLTLNDLSHSSQDCAVLDEQGGTLFRADFRTLCPGDTEWRYTLDEEPQTRSIRICPILRDFRGPAGSCWTQIEELLRGLNNPPEPEPG